MDFEGFYCTDISTCSFSLDLRIILLFAALKFMCNSSTSLSMPQKFSRFFSFMAYLRLCGKKKKEEKVEPS